VDKPKEILFISNRGVLPIKDGHSRRSYNILKGLAENNHVYFLSLFETPEEVCVENIEKLKKICHQVEFLPCPSKKMSLGMLLRLVRSFFSVDPYTLWRHYSKQLQRRADELMSSGQFDLVHCDNMPVCYTVRGRKDVFRSVTDHDVSYLKCLSVGRESRNILLKCFLYFEAFKIKRLEKNIFTQVDLGIVVSEHDKEILKKLCPEGDFIVVENGVELDLFKPSSELHKQNKLLWVGGFNHYPNKQAVSYFLEKIYPLVKQSVPDVSIDIVGGGVTEDFRKISMKDSSIKFTGYVDDPLPYIHSASVFVAPILSGGGTKLKVLEAMATGKAIVCTTIGCEGIDGIPGQHYIVADEAHSFAKAVISVLKSESLRKELQVNVVEFVGARYDYNKICMKLNSHYKNT